MSRNITVYLGMAGALLLLATVVFTAGGTGRAAGNDFSLDLVAAAPDSYVHQGAGAGSDVTPGSLQYDARNVGLYVVESLEGQDYSCDDLIAFFTEVTVDAGASGSQAINIDYDFDAEPTGQPAVGYGDILTAGISGPAPIGDFDGQQAAETGNLNLDGNEDAVLIAEALDPPGSTLGVDAQSVLGTVQVSGLEAGDVAIVRVDVQFVCLPVASNPTGTLHAAIIASATTLGDQVNVGQQDIPMIGLTQLVPTATPTPTAPAPSATSTLTATPTAPTGTPAPPTATPAAPTATPAPPTETPGSPPSTPGAPPAAPQEPAPPPAVRPPVSPPSAGVGAPPPAGTPLEIAMALSIIGVFFASAGAAGYRVSRRP